MQNSQEKDLVDARAAAIKAQEELTALRSRIEQLEVSSPIATWLSERLTDMIVQRGRMSPGEQPDRSSSLSTGVRKTVTSLPSSPPPSMPLPPIPLSPSATPPAPSASQHKRNDSAQQRIEEQEARIKTIEKHLYAEKQLTATLEDALVDLETQVNKNKSEMETWKKKAWAYEDELGSLRKERNANRQSLQAVEHERSARMAAEAAKAQLEERMTSLNKKKKKSSLNCF